MPPPQKNAPSIWRASHGMAWQEGRKATVVASAAARPSCRLTQMPPPQKIYVPSLGGSACADGWHGMAQCAWAEVG